MTNVLYDAYLILNKVYSEKAFVKQAINDTQTDPLNRAFTVKLCYGVLDRDIELSYYLKQLADKTPKLPVRTVLKISMYAMKYLQKKDYFIVKSAVELVKKTGKTGASGFVNAFLRRFSNETIPLPDKGTERLSVKYSYPEFAVKELVKDYGEEKAESIMGAKPPKNVLCFYGTDGEEYLKLRKINYYPTPFYNVFEVDNFTRNADYDEGIYTYQSLGSVAICEEILPCGDILDCCAAPGGKSVRLSYKCERVTAWDIHPHRVALIESYAKRLKRENIFACQQNAKEYVTEYEKKFDAVLCDAPCSGFGVVGDNPDIKINRTEEDLVSLVSEQAAILDTVSRYVKVGGALYYSTCSVFKRENIEQINAFLERHDDFVAERINSALSHEDENDANAFLPDISSGNGYFVAKLKRIK